MQRPPPRTAARSRFSAAAPAGPEAGSYALAEGAAPSPKETPEEFRARLAREKAARAERVAALRKAQGRTPKPLPEDSHRSTWKRSNMPQKSAAAS